MKVVRWSNDRVTNKDCVVLKGIAFSEKIEVAMFGCLSVASIYLA